ncbi:MAG: hypothetical protein J6X26_00570, partial [Bacteroidales bacterium]|nr:hypothetical protein [Bacteroidales bacterium]
VSLNLVESYQGGSYEDFEMELIRSFSMESPITEAEFTSESAEKLADKIYEKVLDTYKRKEEAIALQTYPVMKDVYERMSHQYENVVIPVTDGVKVYQVVTN